MFSYQGQQHKVHALIDAQKRLLSMRQDNMSCQEYLERFKVMVSVVEHCGGRLGYDESRVKSKMDAGYDRLKSESDVKDEYLAILFLLGADRSRYGRLLDELENAHSSGTDNYPGTLVEAYSMILHRKDSNRFGHHNNNRNNHNSNSNSSQISNEVTFTNVGDENSESGTTLTNSTNGSRARRDPGTVRCFKCNSLGHYSNQCPNGNQLQNIAPDETQLFMSTNTEETDNVQEETADDNLEMDYAFVNIHDLNDNRIIIESDDGNMRIFNKDDQYNTQDVLTPSRKTGLRQCCVYDAVGEAGLPCDECEDQGGLYICDLFKGKCIICLEEGRAHKQCENGCLVRSTYLPPEESQQMRSMWTPRRR